MVCRLAILVNIGEVGFLSEQRRSNVAVTRARRHLAIIGDSSTVSHEPFLNDLLNHISTVGEVQSAFDFIFGIFMEICICICA